MNIKSLHFCAILLLISAPCDAQMLDFSDPKTIAKLKKKLHADSIAMDKGNEDEIFIARNRKTQKWGMYQAYKCYVLPAYDTLDFFQVNYPVTTVWNGGKMGAISCPWVDGITPAQLQIPCIYDQLIVVFYHNNYYLKACKNGKWGLINWESREVVVNFIHSSPDFPLD